MKRILLFIPALLFFGMLKSQTITSAASGSWNAGATWVGGAVPTAADQVVIAPSHSITLSADGACRTLTIQNGATNGSLTINVAGTTLTVGDFNTGGGKDSVVIRGDFNMSNGALNIGGRLRQYTPGNYNQTGGIVRIDGNTGSAVTSVADDQYLFQSPYSYFGGFTLTNGTLLFVDPTFGASGNTMVWGDPAMYLSATATIQMGDGVSTTPGGSSLGFVYPVYANGIIAVNNPSGTNRVVTATLALGVTGINVTAGTLNFSYGGGTTVNQLITNNGTITKPQGDIVAEQGVTNNGVISFGGLGRGLYCTGLLLNNAGATITADALYLAGNVTNNGTLTANQTFGLENSRLSATPQAQTVSGTGIFNLSTAQLEVSNTNAAGITLNTSLSVDKIQISGTAPAGNVFLGSNNVTFKTFQSYNLAANNSHFVANSTGRLRFTNLTTTEVLFPVGTGATFNPASINNGSGHTFACGVKTGFSITPPGTQNVNREWDITDVTGGAVSASVTLQWQAADEDPMFSRAACAISHYTGGGWIFESTLGAASGSNPYTRSATGVTSFSPFSVSSSLTVLPVTLTKFNAATQGEKVKLIWQTESENNASHFDIEKSPDGVRFSSIAIVNASNTTGAHDYSSYDASPLNGKNYYRLKMVDTDGKYKYSSIIVIDFSGKNFITVFPNPASGEIHIFTGKLIRQVQVMNVSGQVVKTWAPTLNNRYAIQDLQSGMYFIKIISNDSTSIIKLQKL